MRKIVLGIFILMLLGLSLVSAADTTDIEIVSVTSVSGNPGETVDIGVVIKNNHATDTINTVNIESSNLTFGSNTISKPASTVITNLRPGAANAQTATLRLTIPSILVGGYTGTISVKDPSDNVHNPISATYVVTVNSIAGISILTFDETNALEVSAQEDQARTAAIQIKNTGSTTYTPRFTFNQDDFSDGDKLITLSFTDVEIKPGETKTITLTADIANNIDVDKYSGIITVTGGTATDTFKLEVNVHPEVCKDGPVGDDLRIDMGEPDNGDDFAPGDTMSIDLNVENEGDKNLDVVVEAFLYNVDQDDEIDRIESDAVDIDDGDNEDIDLELAIPFDGDLSEDDKYILFIKAFEDGDEDKQCVEEQIDIEIKRETHDVRIEEFSVNPETLSCGGMVITKTKVVNVGEKEEEDMFIEISVNELNVKEESGFFTLKDHDEEEGEISKVIDLRIPDGTKSGKYEITSRVFFDDGDEEVSETGIITITECKKEEEMIQIVPEVRINGVVKGNPGGDISVPVFVENDEDWFKEFTITIMDSGVIESNSVNVLLADHSEREVKISGKIKKNISPGDYSAQVRVFEKGKLIDEDKIVIKIVTDEEGFKWPISLWILNLLLLVIVIYFIKVLVG